AADSVGIFADDTESGSQSLPAKVNGVLLLSIFPSLKLVTLLCHQTKDRQLQTCSVPGTHSPSTAVQHSRQLSEVKRTCPTPQRGHSGPQALRQGPGRQAFGRRASRDGTILAFLTALLCAKARRGWRTTNRRQLLSRSQPNSRLRAPLGINPAS